ncbi:NCS2 family permease, partial [Bittarella massiliensis]|nr:NCS2 family permease [Bittarella massiliensis (ex Durand et al. 2017)]
MGQLSKFFGLRERKTSVKTEIIAGLTTFMTMAYSGDMPKEQVRADGTTRGKTAALPAHFSARG